MSVMLPAPRPVSVIRRASARPKAPAFGWFATGPGMPVQKIPEALVITDGTVGSLVIGSVTGSGPINEPASGGQSLVVSSAPTGWQGWPALAPALHSSRGVGVIVGSNTQRGHGSVTFAVRYTLEVSGMVSEPRPFDALMEPLGLLAKVLITQVENAPDSIGTGGPK